MSRYCPQGITRSFKTPTQKAEWRAQQRKEASFFGTLAVACGVIASVGFPPAGLAALVCAAHSAERGISGIPRPKDSAGSSEFWGF